MLGPDRQTLLHRTNSAEMQAKLLSPQQMAAVRAFVERLGGIETPGVRWRC